jgi:release factor glutamine methyltransferase
LAKCLQWAQRKLCLFSCPKIEAEQLLLSVLPQNWSKEKIFTNPDKKLNFFKFLQFIYRVSQRKKNIPLAYITKKKQWANLDLFINSSVLIPRDETEILCQYILNQYKNFPGKISSIADIGTGSGCIAIFLAKNFPQAKVSASDISSSSLQVARKNSKINQQTNINFFLGNLLNPLPIKHYNLITANLPYVPDDFPVSPDLHYEPALALFSGNDGLDLYRQLHSQFQISKITFDQLWIEFLPSQKTAISKIFINYNIQFFTDISSDQDSVFFAKIFPK